MQFIEDMPLEERLKYLEKRRQALAQKNNNPLVDSVYEYKYRVEQMIMFKVNAVPMDTVQTKTDYCVTKKYINNQLSVSIEIEEDSFTMYPDKFTDFMDLVYNLEKIKCNADFGVNGTDGRVQKILTHKDVISNWEAYRATLSEKYKFVRAPESQSAVQNLIQSAEKSILNEQALIQELNAKTFFYLFFDKYLVSRDQLYTPYNLTFQSQLFQGLTFNLDINQKILAESPELIHVERQSTMPKDLDTSKIEKLYNKEYQDKIGFKYSEYQATYDANIVYNESPEDINIENAELTINEEVTNNIELIIHHKLRKLK